MNLVRIEESFRTLKGDLGLRPIFHQDDERIEAHVFISSASPCPASPRQKSAIPALWWRPFEKTNAISTIQSQRTL